MEKVEQLEFGKIYHIYNRGINREPVFFESKNYVYFLKLYEKYINPIADTYAWCLLENHFHLLVKIREEQNGAKAPHQPFSNLFNAYAKGINKTYGRTSSLFQKRFKRKLVENEDYLKRLVVYIHNNPVKHGVCKTTENYQWSSYSDFISGSSTILSKSVVLNFFGDLKNFKHVHLTKGDFNESET